MSRLPEIDPSSMTEDQQAVCAETLAAGPRSKLPAPLKAWLYRPELARRGQSLGAYTRYGTCLPSNLSELAILVTARHWLSDFEWYAHKREALSAGVSTTIIDSIEADKSPEFEDDESACVYALLRELYEFRSLAEASYLHGLSVLGRDGMIDLVAIAGYYSLVAMTLNVFDIGVPADAERTFARQRETLRERS